MSSDDIAIRVRGLSKSYLIYDSPRDRLKQFVLPRLQRMAGQVPKSYYREFRALIDISFDVMKGETVGIIGRNGSGKSTLLQIICGTLSPSGGTVETKGRITALLELGSGFNPEFTGRENVYLNASLLGLNYEEIDARFDDIAAFADIGDFIEQPVKTYSSGMTVRLAFSVQAIFDPDILVVDEALAVGDEKFQRKCFARLEELKNQGTSILFVSHSPSSIVELCDRTLLLDQGMRLLYRGAPEAVRAYQQLIYAPAAEQARLACDYRAADQAGREPSYSGPAQENHLTDEQSLDAFDPSLVPETTSVYPKQGAEINSIRILGANGQAVNVLQPGGRYRLVVTGRFLTALPTVHFGIHIKSISGVVITGQRYPEEGRSIERVEGGKIFRTEFSFRMDVLPGVYFVGCGIWSSGGLDCAHRILDGIMFRVVPYKRAISFGYSDMSADEPRVELF